MRHACFNQFLRKKITGFNGNSTYQDWLTFLVTRLNIFYYSLEFCIETSVEKVWMVNTLDWTVGWNWNNTDVVDFAEFFFFCFTSTSHTCQFFIHTEKVLVGNRSWSLRFILDWHTFFSFNRLVQTIRVTATFHSASSKLVDNQDFLLFTHHIVDIKNHDVVGAKGVVDKVSQCYVFDIVEIFEFEVFFCFINTWVRQTDSLRLNIDNVVILIQRLHKVVCHMVELTRFNSISSWNDQWCTSFVDQDRVNLIDQGIVKWTLNHVLCTYNHVVTKVVKTNLWVSWVSNITEVGFFFLHWRFCS